MPACRQIESSVIQITPDGYVCLWELCSVKLDTVYDFFAHVEQHVRGNPRIAKGEEKIVCYWSGKCEYYLIHHLYFLLVIVVINNF